jgi:isoamyl acetate esterase
MQRHIENRFDRHADIVMRGFSGYNSRWALDLLRTSLLAPSNPDQYNMVTIFFGANDAVVCDDPQHCPLDEYQRNISSMVEAFRQHNPEIQILLITPGTVDHTQWESRHTDQVSLYAAAVREVGTAQHVPVVDLWQGSCAFDIASGDLSDGLHLSPSGNAKVYKGVMQVIQEEFLECLPDPPAQMHFPSWKDLAGRSAADTLRIVQSWKYTK